MTQVDFVKSTIFRSQIAPRAMQGIKEVVDNWFKDVTEKDLLKKQPLPELPKQAKKSKKNLKEVKTEKKEAEPEIEEQQVAQVKEEEKTDEVEEQAQADNDLATCVGTSANSAPLTFNIMLLMIGMMILTNCMSMYQTTQLTGTMNKVLLDLTSQQHQLQVELLHF